MAAAASIYDPQNPAREDPDQTAFDDDLWEEVDELDEAGDPVVDSDDEPVRREALRDVTPASDDSVNSALVLNARLAALTEATNGLAAGVYVWKRRRASQYPHPVLRITDDTSLTIAQRAFRLRQLALDNQIATRDAAQTAKAAELAKSKRDQKRAESTKRYGHLARGCRPDDASHERKPENPRPSPPPVDEDAVIAHLPQQH